MMGNEKQQYRASNSSLFIHLFCCLQKIYDYQMQNENQRMVAQQNFSVQKQRADEKRKVQEAIFQSRREEAKQSKMVKQQNEQKKKFQSFKVE